MLREKKHILVKRQVFLSFAVVAYQSKLEIQLPYINFSFGENARNVNKIVLT